MKLTADDVAEAPRLRDNLTITKDGAAYLHLGENYPPGHCFARAFLKEATRRTIHQATRPAPDPLSKAVFAADFERVEQAHRTVQLNDLPARTQQAVRKFIDGSSATADPDDARRRQFQAIQAGARRPPRSASGLCEAV